jgi:acyl-CoA thioesterase FadM
LRHFQEIAGRDLDSFGISYNDLREKNMAFVVSKIAIRFQRPLLEGKTYTFKTSAQEAHGATFPRSLEISDEKGVLCRINSLWALLDFKERKLLRATALGEDLPSFPDLSDGLGCERLLKPNGIVPDTKESRKVYASLLYRNNHLNNCNYADFATDLYPEKSGNVQEMHITFQKEACLGDELLLEGFSLEDGDFVIGDFADGSATSFLCKIKYF